MARIELSNAGGGGGGTLTLTTTGTSGASTLVGTALNIPVYQGQLTLTTTGTSGAATLVGDTLNIPNYATGGTPAGSAGEVQFNSTPAGSFAASSNLAWDNSNVRLNIGAPSSPTGILNIKGIGSLTTVNTRLTNSSDTELLKVLDNGSTNIGTGFNWINSSGRLGIGTSTPNAPLHVIGAATISSSLNISSGLLMSESGNVHSYSAPATNRTLAFITNSNSFRLFPTGSFSIGTSSDIGRCGIRGANTTAGVGAFLVQNSTPSTLNRIDNDGKITYWATNTAAGTTGAQTINRPSGTVNFAAGATSLVVTNSLCTTSSIVLPVIRTNDATATIKNVVPGSGSFTINLEAAATAETSVGFFIIN